jgi:hypothetical protein
VVFWCNSYTIVHFSLDIVEWFKYKLKKKKMYLILIHPPLSINSWDHGRQWFGVSLDLWYHPTEEDVYFIIGLSRSGEDFP